MGLVKNVSRLQFLKDFVILEAAAAPLNQYLNNNISLSSLFINILNN
jgi:hypothetical protein